MGYQMSHWTTHSTLGYTLSHKELAHLNGKYLATMNVKVQIYRILQDKNTYIISDDKDLKQIPGHHFDYGTNSLYEITNEQAVYNLASQLIKGDSTDNITGVEGYGDVKTANYLMEFKKHSHSIPAALHLYQKKYGIFKGTDKFVESWNLIKLRENRGTHFLSQHQRMFDLKKMLLIKNNIDLK